MSKQISASQAKNNFGGLLDDVTSLGRVEIVKHGRLVAVVLSPHAFEQMKTAGDARDSASWRKTHMIPPRSARAARMLSAPSDFDED